MFKILFIFSFVLITFISCDLENITEPFNYERDIPIWLKTKIDSISTVPYYVGTQVYRNKCNGIYIYYFFIPVSSCAYCEVYDQSGNKIIVTDDMRQNCLNDKKNEVLVWEWKK